MYLMYKKLFFIFLKYIYVCFRQTVNHSLWVFCLNSVDFNRYMYNRLLFFLYLRRKIVNFSARVLLIKLLYNYYKHIGKIIILLMNLFVINTYDNIGSLNQGFTTLQDPYFMFPLIQD